MFARRSLRSRRFLLFVSRPEPKAPSVSHWRPGGTMLKRLLRVMLAATVVSQGVAQADEVAARDVSVVRDRAALAAHIDGLAEGDRVAIATDEGIVSGEVVDKDADDVIVDQPLAQGGVERVVIPRYAIQGVQYHQTPKGHLTVQDRIAIVAVVVA